MNKTIFYLSQLFLFLLATLAARSQSGISGEFKLDYVPFSKYVRPIDSTRTNAESNFKRAQLAFEVQNFGLCFLMPVMQKWKTETTTFKIFL
jgi:hypothetical protein